MLVSHAVMVSARESVIDSTKKMGSISIYTYLGLDYTCSIKKVLEDNGRMKG